MNYPYQRYSPEYIQAVEQDLQKYISKIFLSNVIIKVDISKGTAKTKQITPPRNQGEAQTSPE